MSFLETGKKEGTAYGYKRNVDLPPTDVVISLKKQGIENSKIVQTLQNQGYNADTIYDALNQAEVKEGVEGEKDVILESPIPDLNGEFQGADNFNNSNLTQGMQSSGFDTGDGMSNKEYSDSTDQQALSNSNSDTLGQDIYNNSQQGIGPKTPPYETQLMQSGFSENNNNQNEPITEGAKQPINPYSNYVNQPQDSQVPGGFDGLPMDNQLPNEEPYNSIGPNFDQTNDDFIERIEEIAEAIVDEKWNEVVKTINKIIDWKDRMETKIDRMDQQFVDLKEDFRSLSNSVVGKVGEYDKNISKIGIEIQAMEKVFQKVLPSLTENIHELQKITEKAKEKEGKF